jgi:hypothetical protein
MILSFAARLFCVAAMMTGLIHLAAECLCWLASPLLLRVAARVPARQRERMIYLVQLTPLFAALTLTGAICIPQYLHSEVDRAAERVGWLCVAGAVAVVGWYGASLLRGLAAACRTMLFARACRKTAHGLAMAHAGVPVLTCPDAASGVTLVGLFRPFILISERLLRGGLSDGAICVALDHEVAHARHLDNWKLFSLYCLPTLRLQLSAGQTWCQLWRSAAEWAADDDAVRGDSARGLVLAQTLVAVARCSTPERNRVCMALSCAEAELAARIHRLIERPCVAAHAWERMCGLAFSLAGLACAAALLLLSSHDLLEHLLHLGDS